MEAKEGYAAIFHNIMSDIILTNNYSLNIYQCRQPPEVEKCPTKKQPLFIIELFILLVDMTSHVAA